MNLLKLIFGFTLALSLTLPLSTCRGPVDDDSSLEPERIERYAISADSSASDWLLASMFLLPLGFAIASYRYSANIKLEALSLVSVVPAGTLLWAHYATGELALGGILALSSIVCFVGIAVYRLIKAVMGKKLKPPVAPSD